MDLVWNDLDCLDVEQLRSFPSVGFIFSFDEIIRVRSGENGTLFTAFRID